MSIKRRGDSKYAGLMCYFKKDTHMCTYYGRYLVTYELEDRTVSRNGVPACGGHLSNAVRECWRNHGAAIIQEIPGMWR